MLQAAPSSPPHARLPAPIQAPSFAQPIAASAAPQAIALLADARASLDRDIGLARLYLDRLSALLTHGQYPPSHDSLLIPERSPQPSSAAHGLAVRGGLAGWQKRRVIEHIERYLETSLLTNDLAAIARLSNGHFSRAFKISMGETPHSFIIRCRIRRAQMLMLETSDTLSQIACACGLTDQAHLTRLFRRVVGTTPMIWRRAWRQPE